MRGISMGSSCVIARRLARTVGRCAAVLLTAVAVGLAPATATAAEPRKGGVLTVGLEADFPGFDPLGMGALVERMVAVSFYEPLMEISEKGHIVPHLAESLSVSADGMTYTAKLREGVKFHDGTPFDADAVVSNFRRLMDPAKGCRCLAEVSSVRSVDKTGPYTVEFRLKVANAAFPAVLADVAGLQPSPTAIRKAESAGRNYAEAPVGTGPFRFVEWKRGISLRVERNPDYWQKGLPHLDAVVYRPIPDGQTRMASLTAGDIQLAAVPAANDVAAAKSGQTRVKVLESPGLGSVFAMFHAQRAPTNDARVRQALFHATDRALILRTINRGVYPIVNAPFGPGMMAGRIDVAFPEYNPDKARALLKEYGKPVRFTLSVSAVPSSVQMAQVFQQMWQKVGIEVTIEQLEQLQLIRKAIKNDFDAMYFRWPGRADPDLNAYQFFHSSSPRNYTQYRNPEMDKLLEQARSALDAKVRLDTYGKVAQLLARDGTYLFLHSTTNYFLSSRKLDGLPKVPDGLPRVGHVWLER
ncbi:MAG TPA: ABC transporter substrate-binding protein [Quisquiliibacterium sp.]|jgi:peptide/nickel transport system substrate-binding protein|nr:ABC transporter substrate-binding protein [Quisquiliibacterium sp.]HPA90431.1 ABC transporter substrate-binding protein [Quisquiliibacterium sp.]HQN11948.1 ABC transporter substrate-binding protein [Quisquiliibacterium sp.]HQP68407.1 ABC transporter substrate-binding protein [Quisquiliibacterium sp.]